MCARMHAIISIQMSQCLHVYRSGSYIPLQALRDLLMCALDQFHYGSSFVGVSKGTAWGGVSRQYVVIVLRRVQHMQLY